MDAELNEWKSLYGQQQMATQTVAELTRVRQRDQVRQAAEWGSASIILVGAATYLSSVSTSGMLVGVALLVFLALAGAHQWSVSRGLERAMFAAPVDYAKELADRNAREIRRGCSLRRDRFSGRRVPRPVSSSRNVIGLR